MDEMLRRAHMATNHSTSCEMCRLYAEIDLLRALIDPDNPESRRLVGRCITEATRETYGCYIAQVHEDAWHWGRQVLTALHSAALAALVNPEERTDG